MEELSLLDKFGILFNNIFQHPLFIILFFVPIILFFLQKKHGKKVYIIVYFISIFLILIIGGDELFKLFDNFMDGLFMVLYFPNFITLFIVALLNAVFGFVSLFSKNMHKINKIINYCFFGIVQSLFILIILTIRSNDINIYKDNALYSNNDVLSLMQIMIGAFVIQVLSLVIINLINKVTSILDRKDSSLSKSITKQISSLSNSKVKIVAIDNSKVGFINVADKKKTSVPILKPFKFDLDKLQSISLNVFSKNKKYKVSSLIGNETSYLNEVSKGYKYLKLDSNKMVLLNVPFSDNCVIRKALDGKKYKFLDIDSNRYFDLKVLDKPYRCLTLVNKDFSYLNEIIHNKKYRFVKLDYSKNLNLITRNKIFKKVILNYNDFSYLNEIKKKYHVVNLKNSEFFVDVKRKPVSFIDLKDKVVSYLHEIVKKPIFKYFVVDSSKNVEFKNDSNKPDLLKPMNEKVEQVQDNSDMSILNLNIIDIQSTLDVISKFHLMKDVILEGYDEDDAVDGLKIGDFDLLLSILKKYKLIKK